MRLPWPRRRPDRPKRALLVWEFGAGHTHVGNVLAVTRHLRAAGVQCLVALYDTRADRDFAAIGVHTVQSYIWPAWRRWENHDRGRPDHGLIDFLANLGLADQGALTALLAHYDGLFGLFEPDVVLCENAPGAMIAARDRGPVVAFGFSQLLPPIVDGAFPSFDPSRPPLSWPPEELLAGLNAVLAQTGRAPWSDMTDYLRIDAVLPFGPAAFDPYQSQRRPPVLPAHVPGVRPGMRAGAGDEVFVYLQGYAVRSPAVMAALLSLRRPIRAHINNVDPGDAATLAAAGIALEPRPVPMSTILERSRCALHHGGQGFVTACLAAGLPQVVLSKELDNQLTGGFVAERGLGEHRWVWDATTPWIVEATRRAYDEPDLRRACSEAALDFEGWLGADPAAIVAAEACRLAGISAPIRLSDESETTLGAGLRGEPARAQA